MAEENTITDVPEGRAMQAVPSNTATPLDVKAPTKPYRILVGKHFVGRDPTTRVPIYKHRGDVVHLTEKQATTFKGKFGPVGVDHEETKASEEA